MCTSRLSRSLSLARARSLSLSLSLSLALSLSLGVFVRVAAPYCTNQCRGNTPCKVHYIGTNPMHPPTALVLYGSKTSLYSTARYDHHRFDIVQRTTHNNVPGSLAQPLVDRRYQRYADTTRYGDYGGVPAVVSVTQVNESGLLYSIDELQAIGEFAREKGLVMHMDGARFANAVEGLACSPADMTWRRYVLVCGAAL